MAQKIKLGNRPKSFARTITFPLLGEGKGSIGVEFKYRTRSEFAAFIDAMQAEVKSASEEALARAQESVDNGESVASVTQAAITDRQNEFNVHYLLGVLDGWSLDIPLDRESAMQLADELPAAVTAIMNDYRAVIVEGRLGN